MTPITIEHSPEKGYTVRQNDRYSDGMCFDEMLGLVVALTYPEDERFPKSRRDWMKTKEEWDAYNIRLKEIINEPLFENDNELEEH